MMRTSIDERAGTLMTIPLSLLVSSPNRNVRKAGVNGIDELAASIKAQGLMQNLTVIEHQNKGGRTAGKYEVVAGSRRLRALQKLAADGEIRKDEEVVCKVTGKDQGLIASLTENSGREALHPADEFEAFRLLVDEGRSIEDISAHFGVSPVVVQRRLKLARVAPELILKYRNGEATLEQLIAMSISDDHEAQLRVWNEAPSWRRDPSSLRHALLDDELDIKSDPVVRFVTVDAYEKAGGEVRRDLFSGDDSGTICEVNLLHLLALERLEVQAEALREEGWSWVDTRLVINYGDLAEYTRAPKSRREPTATEQVTLSKLNARLEQLSSQFDALESDGADDAQMAKLENAIQHVQEKMDDMLGELVDWLPQIKEVAGAIVGLSPQGEVQIERGLVKVEDARRARELLRITDSAEKTDHVVKRVHSEALIRRLTAHRTVVLQAVLASSTRIALAALAQRLVEGVMLDQIREGSPLQLSSTTHWHALQAVADDVVETKAWRGLVATRDAWSKRLAGRDGTLLQTLIELPTDELLELIAFCAAVTLNVVTSVEDSEKGAAIAGTLAVDMAEWWQPTSASYLSHVSKARIMAILKETQPGESLRSLESLKKAELVATAEQMLADKRWLPDVLKFSTVAEETVERREEG